MEMAKQTNHARKLLIPARADILSDFQKWTSRGSDPLFQFERAVRRWINCGYSAMEIPAVFKGFTPEQFRAALSKATTP